MLGSGGDVISTSLRHGFSQMPGAHSLARRCVAGLARFSTFESAWIDVLTAAEQRSKHGIGKKEFKRKRHVD